MSRRIECGGMQGHGNPLATRRPFDSADFEDAPITTPDELSAWAVFAQIALVAAAAACTVVALIKWLTA